ncbi:early nodulin-like protein 5 [Salvia miltiorrhiza]|uniref:early nodulin-like protein 5 n=1 Tax=Salvia miltiorrhiza TaxID=226208 RepID=UPI0025AC2320|nr:early nodulin-like protein 5 [Salvia miltiorrhiza]
MASSALKSCFLFIFFSASVVAGFQFDVGGKTGWMKPTGKEPESYNQWAAVNRFHIGDTLYFKYQNDSVLVVTAADYLNCNTSNPISNFRDGPTVFEFDRSGFFYFISGRLDHCRSGQKLIIRVMHPSEAPSPSPAAGDGGSDWAPPAVNSTTKIALVSYYMTAFAGLLAIFYFFA